jgi:aspartate ammonia-lyase
MAQKRTSKSTRIEHDLLGTKPLPADARYGIQTLRAIENFHISGVPVSHYPDFVRGLAMVKMAAARANADVGALPKPVSRAIESACRTLIAGKGH